MKKLLNQICKLSLQASCEIAKPNALKTLSQHDVDELEEAITLLNDIYEELYKKVFEDDSI